MSNHCKASNREMATIFSALSLTRGKPITSDLSDLAKLSYQDVQTILRALKLFQELDDVGDESLSRQEIDSLCYRVGSCRVKGNEAEIKANWYRDRNLNEETETELINEYRRNGNSWGDPNDQNELN